MARRAEAEFDRVAAVYDATRGELALAASEALRSALRRHDARSILEVGVGTGRIAIPLQESGWLVTGVDLSRGMLGRARAKGFLRAIRADAEHLPFGDEAFDSTVFAHVLHVLADPSAMLRETARVTRGTVLALLRPSGDAPEDAERRRRIRAVFQEARERHGLPPPSRTRRWWREAALLRAVPPRELISLPVATPSRSAEEWISALERRAFSVTADLPEEVLAEVVAELRRRLPELPAQGPRSGRLAVWSAEQLRTVALVDEPPASGGVPDPGPSVSAD